jgi:ATP-dependent DNA helicase RecQ
MAMESETNWKELLGQHFGFAEFRPGQLDALQALESSGRALAVFPTGAGKSLCYQLPALIYDHLTLVVSALIALMKDQIYFLRSRGIAAARLDSSLSLDQMRLIQEQIRSGTLKLLYVAPERFKNERFLEMIGRQRISLFAIDEAHCISEWGHNFRPDYLKLADTAKSFGAERILTLTATATPSVVKDICMRFDISVDAAIVTGFYRPNLRLAITGTTSEQRDGLLLRRLETRPPGPTIVYVTLQKTAESVAAYLTDAGMSAFAYHAGMNTEERNATQENWMASDHGIVVATIAFGMGIDKANVRYVYHYNLAKSLENYSQEIGRAGRDGAESIVEMFASPEDIPILENFVYGDTPTEQAIYSLVNDMMAQGEHFDVSLYELADKHDIRQLVLKTALTYLELLGAIREGAPYYAGYKFYLKRPAEEILTKFPGERGQFIRQLFAQARKGVKWLSLRPDDLAHSIGQPRQRIVTALDYLHDQGDIVLEASEVRSRFTRLHCGRGPDELAEELVRRFTQRENDEINRLARLIAFVEHTGCHANALAAYFGEIRDTPCGQCAQCITGKAVTISAAAAQVLRLASADKAALRQLQAEHPKALSHPRQQARFLCGLTSPAISRARLSRNGLSGKYQEHRFKDVLSAMEQMQITVS